jgi:hypothetical protein
MDVVLWLSCGWRCRWLSRRISGGFFSGFRGCIIGGFGRFFSIV